MPNLPDSARRLLARLHDGEPVRTRPLNRREVEALSCRGLVAWEHGCLAERPRLTREGRRVAREIERG